ncbi:hypothetical protein R9C00_14280 [Flammeovirgaceae bacterium SG7u.111]|nr:hypothetical protein [Flammeovirgaceae bacterium SG7u.132]WPO38624.1 hypothetical protein R9C00_14280 [Flammeovirgaceae bacterium SG7u.111]
MKELLLKNWSVMRIFRVALGSIALANGFAANEVFMMIVGGIVLYQGIANVKCGGGACTTGNCEIAPKNENAKNQHLGR